MISILAIALTLTQSTTKTSAAPAAAPSGYHVQKSFDVGGDGGWDYLTFDGDAHRLFVSRSSHVMVVDTESGKVSGDIPETEGVHGIALAPESGHGFTSNGRAGNATMFDLKTLKTLGTVELGGKPEAGVSDGAGHVFVNVEDKSEVVEFDAKTLKVLAHWPIAPGE